ncbi:Kinesin-like protein KIF6, partial [Geodia barretti]
RGSLQTHTACSSRAALFIQKTTGVYEVVQSQDGLEALSFTVPRSEAGGAVNNRRETFSFKFSRVFDSNTGQEEVFDAVSREVIDNCLEGYNGTIFAYGQTGSGKTFTITGGVERFGDRGLIPRSLSYLFQQYHKSPGTIFTTHISYLEIYNECGYDLLDPRHEMARLEDLPKVTLMEDRESVLHLRNLSLHPANNEEEALNWLFLGDTNRVMAETPMNMASTRSHCIFTVHISAREPSSQLIRRAKLHLVDLAGSERVGRTGVEGTLLTEAKYINLSLHFLEQVIVALSDKSRSHVPYRNSMMTSVLRDSLGGNCMTSMIATCSVEKRNIDETISTCRFSQRVALIKNEVRVNEELDPKLMVRQLRQQVAELREELSLATGGEERDGDLELAERERCERLVQDYLQDSSPEARLLVGGDMRKIQLCFSLLKARVKSPLLHTTPKTATPTNQPTVTADPRLEEVIRQRDEEINMLLKTLKQERRKIAELEARLRTTAPEERGGAGEEVEERKEERVKEERGTETTGEQEAGERKQAESRKAWKSELSRARQEAFDQFRRDCPIMDQVNQHKTDLRTKYSEAKALGEEVQSSRTTISEWGNLCASTTL